MHLDYNNYQNIAIKRFRCLEYPLRKVSLYSFIHINFSVENRHS